MIYYKDYKLHKYKIDKNYDSTIYTFDIETTSYLILDGKIYSNIDYLNLSEDDKKRSIKQANMYIWMLGVNDTIYYGRTWDELVEFISYLDELIDAKKMIFVHNLGFEFQFLKSVFKIESVMARKSRRPMAVKLLDYNVTFRCTLFMTNCKLEELSEVYKLDVEKLVGNLDYNKLRHSNTPLTDLELSYCENDCLVLYEYIKYMLTLYKSIDKLPLTSTGQVRRELRNITLKNYNYRRKVSRAVNTDPHVYNMLNDAFMGGYTHANYIYTDTIVENITSFDFTSSYPFCMTNFKFPMTAFRKCNIKKERDMIKGFAYLVRVIFYNLNSKYDNNFLSASRCKKIKGGFYDNGRIIKAEYAEIVLTDIDFKLILKTYNVGRYEVVESFYSLYSYLPKELILFILDKYVKKTEYKGIKEKELLYNLEKARFNSIYGMSVTRTIADKVLYEDEWKEIPLTNEEIIDALEKEKKTGFQSFAWGVWVTSIARKNLIENIINLDKWAIYSDTDSIKLLNGFDTSIINSYNEKVKKRLKFTSSILNIPYNKFAPVDINGVSHPLGLFEMDAKYKKFITQGAKKYAYVDEDDNIKITVAGVPKKASVELKDLDQFRDNFIFSYKSTNKNFIEYNDNQFEIEMTDYLGNKYTVKDTSGAGLYPCEYELGKSLDYIELITDKHSKYSVYDEGE